MHWGCDGPEGCETAGANGDRTRAYDAQNRLIGDTISEFSPSAVSGCVADRVDPPHHDIAGVSETLTYEWGPNGHPDRWSGGGSPLAKKLVRAGRDDMHFVTSQYLRARRKLARG